jgi:hypothetical protein
MRYQERRSVQVIAQSLQLDARKLYRRFDRLLRELRQAVATAGTGTVS